MRLLLGIPALLLLPPPVATISMRSHSVEWWTNLADEIAVVKVVRSRDLKPLNDVHLSQELECRKEESLRGTSVEEWTFRHDFHWTRKVDRAVEAGDEFLFFLFREPKPYHKNPVFWVQLTRPNPPHATHAAYDNQARHLATKDEILKAVRAHVVGKAAQEPPRRRGVIVPMPGVNDMYWDFVRTADPELKPTLMKDLGSPSPLRRCNAIHNLLSYPDPETANAIRPLLGDPDAQEVRQAAYLALTLLGEKAEKPNSYREDFLPGLFRIGFDDPTYFPYGNWPRLPR